MMQSGGLFPTGASNFFAGPVPESMVTGHDRGAG